MRPTPPRTSERRREGTLNALRRGYHKRRFRIHVDAWAICIGVLAMWQMVMFIAWPETLAGTSVADAFGAPWGYFWSGAYAIAGGCIVYGVVKPDTGIDAFGLAILAGTIFCQLVAIVAIAPDGLTRAAPQLVTPMVAAIARLRVITGKVREPADPEPHL